MAMPYRRTHETKSKRSCFLGCFGLSEKKPISDKISLESNQSCGRKRTRWSWSGSRLMKKFVSKTVPLDTAAKPGADGKSNKVNSPKPKPGLNLTGAKPERPAAKHKTSSRVSEAEVVEEQVASDQVIEEQETGQKSENAILGSGKRSEQMETPKHDTCQKRLLLPFCRRTEPTRTGTSQPDSPAAKSNTKRRANLSHSVSLPVSNREIGSGKPNVPYPVAPMEPQREKYAGSGCSAPVTGFSILMVTLIVLLVWGKFCAVLCTSAWFYLSPRLGPKKSEAVMGHLDSGDWDLNSDEYKKKVVLRGFLDRPHRCSP